MKIFRYFQIILLAAGFMALVSCSSSAEKAIVGKWQGSEASLKAAGSFPLNPTTWAEGVNVHKHTIYSFKRDNTFTVLTEYKDTHRNAEGTWSISKDSKELTLVMSDNSVPNKLKLVEINDQKLTWIMDYPFGELSTTFIKVK